MSQAESPIRTIFDAQRTLVKQGEQTVKQGFGFQRSANRLAMTGLKSQESFQRQGLELAQAATQAYVNTVAMMTGSQPSREQYYVDDTFARLKRTHAQLFDVAERELDRGITSFDELSDEYVDALDRQIDQLLETHRTIEDETAQNFAELSETLREQLKRTQEVQDRLEDRFEEQSTQAEEMLRTQIDQAEEFQRELERETERTRRELREESWVDEPRQTVEVRRTEAERTGEREPEHELERIDGIGPTFRDRLVKAGITSLDELAAADPETVAGAADISEERAEEWIEEAQA